MIHISPVARGCRFGRRLFVCLGSLLAACGQGVGGLSSSEAPSVDLVAETIASGFDTIWDLTWGPDGVLWVTERAGAISRVDPQSGAVQRAGDLAVAEIGEGGLMGLVLHPDFPLQPFVYAVHTYQSAGGLRNRLVRMSFDNASLGDPEVLFDGIPGASIHNGSRLTIGPDRLLYVTTGDAANPNLAQDPGSPAGKVLRLALDGTPAAGNPSGSAVYSLGHRNPQGIAFSPQGTLYITEHGPSDNDELNRIEAGGNYGWPEVRGRCDGDAGPRELEFCEAWNVVEPIAHWTPTIAPAGLAFYAADRIPTWRGSLLFTTLKGRALVRISLSTDGRTVTGQEVLYAGQFGRLRDVLVAPNGDIYIGTSNKDGRGTPFPLDDRIVRIRPR